LWRPTPVAAHDHAELSYPGGSCRSHQQGSCDDGYQQGYRREDPDQGARSGTPARHLDSSLTRLATCSPGQDRLGPGAGLSPSSAGIGGPRPRGNTTASASTI